MYSLSDKFILYHQSLDAYLFLRFLRTIIFLCVVGCLLTWPTLMPVNATGGGSSTELDKIGIGNIIHNKSYYAHAVLAWVFFSFILFCIARERLWLTSMRQAWALSKHNASRLSSRTVLFLSAPEHALEEENMARIFGEAAVRIWPASRATSLQNLVADRNSSLERLEQAETELIQRAHKKVYKERRRGSSDEPSFDTLPPKVRESIRPRHHLGHAMTGDKVDSIHWLREHIAKTESEIQQLRQQENETDDNSAAVFVEYKTTADAQHASQQVLTSDILALRPRYLSVAPKEVIWENMFLSPERRASQEGLSITLVVVLILFWSIPSGFIGLVSNISYLADSTQWLAWLKNLPDPVIGLLSGLGPPLTTSLLSKYVPNIFRYIFRSFGGGATTVANELLVQKWFYIFQVTQVFLVTAVFSGAATVFSELMERAKNPESIPKLLARELPKSSNYYITYFIIQGVTTSADNLLNWTDLMQYLVLGRMFDKTPRQKFNRYTSMKGISWGKVFPKYANFAIIAISYACIAPLVLGFAAAGLTLYYFSYRYNLLWVIQTKVDTRGEAYAVALQHLLTGVYIAELALIGIFSIANAKGPLIMLTILFLVTILYHHLTNKYLVPLEKYIPLQLASDQGQGNETDPLLGSAEQGQVPSLGDSSIYQGGRKVLPASVLGPLARFFEPHRFATYRAVDRWLREDEEDFEALEEAPEYSEDQLNSAYKNPAFTSTAPVVWLPKDHAGVSRREMAENDQAEVQSTDQGAWLDEEGNVCWDSKEFHDVPLLSSGVRY
jgi:hypothetical protein